jgi:RNA polymerase sigma-70 factor (ECF subfamily)
MDHRRFLALLLPTEPSLRAYLLSATGDRHATEDLLQEVSAILWEKFGEYDPQRRFLNWALGVARLEVLKWRHQHARRREVLSPETLELLGQSASERTEPSDPLGEALRKCLEKLGDSAQRVVRMKYFDKLKIHDVASRLNRRTGAIEMMLVRSRRALRHCLEKQQATEMEWST